jgi:hypothetical protein
MDRKLVEKIVKKTLEMAKDFLDNEGAVLWLEEPGLDYDSYCNELTVSITGEELSFEEEVIFDQTIDRLEDEEIIPRLEKK